MSESRLPSYGGQALIEGVVMRGKKSVAAAFRKPDGEIEVIKEKLTGIYQTGIRKIPLLRGLILLWDSLGLGSKFLTISANMQTGEDEKIEGFSFYLTLGISFAIAIGVFFVGPAALAQYINPYLGLTSWVSNLLEGLIRLLLLVGYMYLIGRMEDIKRVFAYHGAEHKTINAFEDNAELTPDVVKNYSVQHARCGTGFLLSVVIISVLLFTILGPMPMLWRIITRILLIPLVAGLAYEYIKWTADHSDNPVVKVLMSPNLALQNLSTNEPDLEMLEVSIRAFNEMKAFEEELEQSEVN